MSATTVSDSTVSRTTSRWPTWLRRRPMERLATVVIIAGVTMLLQPYLMVLYTYSFVTTLAGTLIFTVVSKFPE